MASQLGINTAIVQYYFWKNLFETESSSRFSSLMFLPLIAILKIWVGGSKAGFFNTQKYGGF